MLDVPYKREHLEWRPITGFKDQYEVSNYGDFHILPYEFIDKVDRHITRKEKFIWSEDLCEYGGDGEDGRYLGIHLGGMSKSYAHILAAKEFCPNMLSKPEVNHKDGNTKNNYCGCEENQYLDSNLEWVTRKENMEHASANGLINHESVLRKYQCKKNRERVNYDVMKKPVLQLDLLGNVIAEYESISSASQALSIAKTAIGTVAKKTGYHKTAGGFNWVFKDEYVQGADYTINVDQGSGGRKKVAKISEDGEILQIYESIKCAAIANNFPLSNYIGEVCAGKRKTYKGYRWKFID